MAPVQAVCNVQIHLVNVLVMLVTKAPNATLSVVVIPPVQVVQLVISPQVNVLATMVILVPLVLPKQVRFFDKLMRHTYDNWKPKSTFLTDPTYVITCQISASGVDLTTDCASNTGNCLIITLSTFAFDVLVIPACTSSVSSTQKYLAGNYLVQANAKLGGTDYSSPQSPITITSSDVTVNLVLSW